MRSTLYGARWVPAAAAVLLLSVSACGGGAASSGDAASGNAGDGVVTTRTVEGAGSVLVDAEGNPLYTNEAENDGTVKCVEGCADFWPPLDSRAGSDLGSVAGVDGTFGTVSRPDGSKQVTLDGHPLYTFTKDEGTKRANGDGFEDDFQGDHFVWHVVAARADGSATTSPSTEGGGGGYGGY